MAELATLADTQQTAYLDKVTRQLHVMAQARKSLPVIDQRSNRCATPPTVLRETTPPLMSTMSPHTIAFYISTLQRYKIFQTVLLCLSINKTNHIRSVKYELAALCSTLDRVRFVPCLFVMNLLSDVQCQEIPHDNIPSKNTMMVFLNTIMMVKTPYTALFLSR